MFMEKIIITEEQVKQILDNVLTESTGKISRQDFNRTQFKIEELENSLNETIKELRKLQDSMPNGLKPITDRRMRLVSQYLISTQSSIKSIKEIVKKHKRKIYSLTAPPQDHPVT